MSILSDIGDALSDLWDAICSLFSSSPASTAAGVEECPLKGLSPQRAQEVFDQLKARKDIPFDFPYDCCYARASEMCHTMAQEGIPSGKVWTYGNLQPVNPDRTPVRYPKTPDGEVITWGYHVAPTVNVTQPDGSVVPMVMDPSLSDRPLTVPEWNALAKGPDGTISQTAFTDSAPFYRDPNGRLFYENPRSNRHSVFTKHAIDKASWPTNPNLG